MAAGKRKAPDGEMSRAAQTGEHEHPHPRTASPGPGSTADTPAQIPGSRPVLSPAAARSRQAQHRVGTSSEPGDAYYRSLYASEPDFRQLGRQDAEFARVLKPNGQLDFSDPAATLQLTKTLLNADFGLKIELPEDRLCPPAPNRHSYIMWLKGLLDTSSYDAPGGKAIGLDIGTGASCIYPLLGCTQRPWSFFATDVDDKNLSCARRNVELNDLQSRVKVVPREPDECLIPLDDLAIDSIDFVMTNPPFYYSEEELLSSAEKKFRPPYSACTGAPVEMVCDGGEVGFVGRMMSESLVLRERVQWYTSMLGKLSSLETLVDRLRESGVDNYAVTEFVQGNKTRRWAVGWSFGAMRPAQDVARGMRALQWRRVLPAIVEADILSSAVSRVASLASRTDELMQSLELLRWDWDWEKLDGIGRAGENVWGRTWRRKRMREKKGGGMERSVPPVPEDKAGFGFLVRIRVGRQEATMTCRWLEGHDQAMFESFCGFLKTRLAESYGSS